MRNTKTPAPVPEAPARAKPPKTEPAVGRDEKMRRVREASREMIEAHREAFQKLAK